MIKKTQSSIFFKLIYNIQIVRKISLIPLSIIITGCSYNSMTISSRNDYSLEAVSKTGAETILSEQIPIESLLKNNTNKKGRFHVYMCNSTLFIEAGIAKKTRDTITLEGNVYDKSRNDSLRFIIEYSLRENHHSIDQINQNEFRYSIFPNENNKNDSLREVLNFSKIKNYEIQKDILELYTGEVRKKKHEPYNFVIINDPEKFPNTIDPVCIITIVDLEKASIDCKTKFKNKCIHGYNAKIKWKLSFYKDIKCECKNK